MKCVAALAIIISYPTSVSGIINCFIKNNQEILLYLVDFTLQEQPEDNLMVAIFQAWYNASCTIAAKPVKIPGIALSSHPVFN